MDRFICIHGHFYQPPRENPWIEEVEAEDSAYPYHDWNTRITAECYAPNTASRILDSHKKIIDIVNNYASISFDFGPTLLTWLERNSPDTYSAILRADQESRERFSGHGSALAQAYNHLILPLANARDKRTQIIWGIRDFQHRFGRLPEGMWLPETAVDSETLAIMAETGILFTILSPAQAARVRRKGEAGWTGVNRDTLDCSMPYSCTFPDGRSIAVFFYDYPLAQDLAFSTLLENGDVFVGRILQAFSRTPHGQGLVSMASDGETYGHHHRFADMALAYALYRIGKNETVENTIFGEFLASHPPTHEVGIRENTSWSCAHGIERWRSNCGDSTRGSAGHNSVSAFCEPTGKGNPAGTPAGSCTGWTQEWRVGLRNAMDRVRDDLIPFFETRMKEFVTDPWVARDNYIDVILDRSPSSQERFFARHASRPLQDVEKTLVLKLLEMQRHAMLMYTSCGWFFDDISGIESLQVMRYACRAMQLARETGGPDPEPAFIAALSFAKSNIPDKENGAAIYHNYVIPSVIDPTRIIFNYALTSLIGGPEPFILRHYQKKDRALEKTGSGNLRMLTGIVTLRSGITGEEQDFEFAVIQLGTYEFMGGIRPYHDEDRFARMRNRIRFAFREPEDEKLIRTMENEFALATYSFWNLFPDARREILFRLLDATLRDLESSFRQIFRQHITLIHAMVAMQIPVPAVIGDPVRYILNRDLMQALLAPELDLAGVRHLVNEMIHGQFPPDRGILDFTVSNALALRMQALAAHPDNIPALEEITGLFSTLAPLGLEYDLWKSQNDYFRTGMKGLARMKKRAAEGDPQAQKWISLFHALGKWLGVNCS